MEKEKVKDFVKFQVRRKVTNLYKNFLFILEDMGSEESELTEESYQHYRKRILDHGNDTIREIDECLDNLEIKIK